jgi:glutaconate CoA-transferase, subunit B
VYPGVTVAEAKAGTGWDLVVSASLEVLDPPSAAELSALRALQAATPGSEGGR